MLSIIGAAQNETSHPNIIYINVDDLGWKDLSCMGSTYFETPNIDKFSKEGMTFTQGYASASNCAPSRACLMSGQNTPRHGIYTVGSSERGNKKLRKLIPIKNTNSISDQMVTMAEGFKLAGYITGSFGKWHISENPLNDGFDINIGGNHMGNPGKKGYFAPYNSLPNLDLAVIGENLTDRLTTEAISFIESNKEKPFFLYLPFYAVHTPLMGKSELVQKYEKKGGRNGQDNPEFAAMVENVDMNIGRLLLLIDELKLRENTLIVITSDNGGIRAISHQDPLRAGKGSYYEGGVRVPYIVRWPAQIAADTINNSPIVNLDFFPTFMHLIGVSIENKVFDGKNITRLLMGEEMDKRPIFWHFPIYLQAYNSKKDEGRDPFFRTRPGSAVVYDNWKLHHYFEDDAIELYNLHDDLGEKNDLSKVHAEKAAELFELLNNWRVEVGAEIPRELNLNYVKNFENSKKRKQTKN